MTDPLAILINGKISDVLDHPLFTRNAAEHAKILVNVLQDIERDCDVAIVVANLPHRTH